MITSGPFAPCFPAITRLNKGLDHRQPKTSKLCRAENNLINLVLFGSCAYRQDITNPIYRQMHPKRKLLLSVVSLPSPQFWIVNMNSLVIGTHDSRQLSLSRKSFFFFFHAVSFHVAHSAVKREKQIATKEKRDNNS